MRTMEALSGQNVVFSAVTSFSARLGTQRIPLVDGMDWAQKYLPASGQAFDASNHESQDTRSSKPKDGPSEDGPARIWAWIESKRDWVPDESAA